MSASYKRQVFLSYNSADRPHVALVAQALATARIPFWWDDAAMGPGDEWLTRMNLPLKEAPAALIFLGSSGFGQTQEQEVQTFLRRRREEKTFVLIPVLLPGAPNEMPYEFLPNYLPVDLRGGDADIERLIAKLAELLTPADEPGPRPILPAATPGLDSVGTDGAASVRDERKRRREAVTSLFGKVYPSEGRNDAPEEPSIKSRRRVLGGAPRWRYLKHYYPRPNLLAEIRPQFDSFCSSESDREGWIPVFWLDGRSGDGKSILLLQLAEDIARRNPEALFIKLKTAHELPEAIRKLSAHREHTFIVIDDLHRSVDDSIARLLDDLLDEEIPAVPILTCGPTIERKLFSNRHGSLFDINWATVRGPSPDELEGFSRWLDRPRKRNESDLLVEFLFELKIGEPLSEFAANFRDRLVRNSGAELVEQVRAILAVNGLDLVADQSLLSAGNGIHFVRQLAKPPDSHFDLNRRLISGEPGVWFEHSRIARRLFELWSRDPGNVHVSMALRFAEALAVSVRVYAERQQDFDALLEGLSSRLGAKNEFLEQTVSLNEVIRHLLHLLADEKRIVAHIVLRMLHLRAFEQWSEDCGVLIGHALRLSKDPALDAPRRCQIAVAALVLARRQVPSLFAEAERTARAVLWSAEARMLAGSNVVFLASRPEAASAGWTGWAREWVEAEPTNPGASVVLPWLLVRSRRDDSILQMADRWLATNGEAASAQGLLSARVAVASAFDPVIAQATKWLDTHRTAPASHHLVLALLNVSGSREDVLTAVFDWLGANVRSPRAWQVRAKLVSVAANRQHVIESALESLDADTGVPEAHPLLLALLPKTGFRPDIVARALSWIEVNGTSRGVPPLVESILTNAHDDGRIVKAVKDWLDRYHSSAGAVRVWQVLLVRRQDDPETVLHALEWLCGHDSSPEAHLMLAALVAVASKANGVVDRAIQWVDDNRAKVEVATVLTQLLISTSGHDGIVERAVNWCDEHVALPDAAPLMAAITQHAVGHPKTIELASEWLRENPEAPGRYAVATSLLTASGGRAHADAHVLAAMESQGPSAGKVDPLTELLSLGGSQAELTERAFAWLDANASSSHRHNVLGWLLSAVGTRADVIRRALDWLDADRNGAATPSLLAKLVASNPDREEFLGRALTWVDDNRTNVRCLDVLDALLAATAGRSDVVGLALDWLALHQKSSGSHQLMISVISATAARGDVLERALQWLDANPSSIHVRSILAALITATRGAEAIVERGIDWLSRNMTAQGSHQIVEALLARAANQDRTVSAVMEWLRVNRSSHGAPHVVATLLTSANREDVVELGKNWFDEHRDAAAHQVLNSLIAAAGDEDEVVARALAWLAENRMESGSMQVANSLLRAAGGRAEVTTSMLEWVAAHPPSMNQSVLANLVSSTQGRADVVDRAVASLQATSQTPNSSTLVAQLMRWAMDRDDVSALVSQWNEQHPSAPDSDLVRRRRVELLFVRDPDGPELNEMMRELLLPKASLYTRGNWLGRWLRAGGPSGSAVAFILERNREPGYKAALAWACARNPDVVLAAIRAARSPREAAKILCYLISRGTQYVPGAGAEILKLVLEWPPDHIGYFWYALLGATELAVASYSGRFARWVEYNFVPDEVVNALARRQDLDEALLNGKQGTAAWLLRQRVLQKRASFIGDLPGAEFQ